MNEVKQFSMGGVIVKLKDETARNGLDSLKGDLNQNGAGAHNSIYRGKSLGGALTPAQAAAIAGGTFDGLFVGDYWEIGGVVYRIAHFDYWLNTGDTNCGTHHAVIVPDACMYNAQMHNTASGGWEGGAANTTDGGYVGSDMHNTGLNAAKAAASSAFGAGHILTHRELLVNAVSSGRPSSGAWYDSTVELMNECMVYGSYIFTPGNDGANIPYRYTIDKSQLALFAHRPDLIGNRAIWWLRDVVSGAYFALVSGIGTANYNYASYACGVRPAFGIC